MSELSAAEYCRQIEQHLCRRNGGHLVRIVGPAFEKVTGWAGQGIPIKVVFRGIDRCIEREEAKGPRRRPVRVEFCEADVLDAFDDWRRAVGAAVGLAEPTPQSDGVPAGSATEQGAARRRHVALQAHIDRVMTRLTQCRLDADLHADVAAALDRALAELDALRAAARGARGERRDEVKEKLREVDATLIAAARAVAPSHELARVDAEARRDLQAFKQRMPADAFERAVAEETARQLRDLFRFPDVAAGI
jgi:hypothetical protein